MAINEQVRTKLEQLHLTPSEAKTYTALLEIGTTSAGKIIEKTLLHRSVVYESLKKLIDKKLVFSFQKSGIKYFQLLDPGRLFDTAKEQFEIAKNLVPKLKKMAETEMPEITIYEGLESYRRFWIELYSKLAIGTTDFIAGSTGLTWQKHMGNLTKKFLEIQHKRNIKWQMIVFEKNDFEMELKKAHPNLYEYRLIERKMSDLGNFNIFADDILVLHSATEPVIIEIKNKNLVKVFKNIFDILWETGEKI